MFKVIAIAGTFDHLHKGHEYFISQAFKSGEKVIIGLTSDAFVKSKIFNFQTRKKELEKVLQKKGLLKRTLIIAIDDLYGPAIKNTGIEALVVTEETKNGGEKVNKRRRELGLPQLKLIIIPFVLAEDEEKIASTRIRFGEIDRKGLLYELRLRKYHTGIPEELRMELKKPQGILLKGDPNNINSLGSELCNKLNELKSPFIITVGDEVTKLANYLDAKPKLSIFDFRVNRKEKYKDISELGIRNQESGIREVTNPQGYITRDLVKSIKESIKEIIGGKESRIVIKIEGEDDLAAVPSILLAPLGSVVLYGQPAFVPTGLGLRRGKPVSGVVIVEVTEERKQTLIRLLNLSLST